MAKTTVQPERQSMAAQLGSEQRARFEKTVKELSAVMADNIAGNMTIEAVLLAVATFAASTVYSTYAMAQSGDLLDGQSFGNFVAALIDDMKAGANGKS